MIEIRMQI